MMRFWKYLQYIVRHKWFVFVAGTKVGCNWWRLLIHDMSKFLPGEWIPYSRTFYKEDGSKQYQPTIAFDTAWLYHQHRNKHHWQYWRLREDSGNVKLIPMPLTFIKEMVADWAGAGRAITGEWEIAKWYVDNAHKIDIHPSTRHEVERILTDVFGLDDINRQ